LLFLFYVMIMRHPLSTLFPYTTLFRSMILLAKLESEELSYQNEKFPLSVLLDKVVERALPLATEQNVELRKREADNLYLLGDEEDRKSTRLNSSHVKISYAVFCLKKKK